MWFAYHTVRSYGPKYSMEFYKGIIERSFSYNSFVKLSLYNVTHLSHCLFLWTPNIAWNFTKEL